jgi:cbb3-type cytochrome oxidase maturation protein
MSNVSSGTVLTLVVPLALLMVVLGLWAFAWWRLRRPGRKGDPNAPIL